MSDRFSPLNDNEVLHVSTGRILLDNPTFKVGELLDALAQSVSDGEGDWSEDHEGWFSDGADCEVLRVNGAGWQRGRVRVRIEFAPDKEQDLLTERSSANGGPGRERVRFQASRLSDDDFKGYD
jgi:KGK domain